MCCELIQSIDDRRQSERAEQTADPLRQVELGQECYTSTFITRHQRAIAENDPPALAPPFLGHRREEPIGFRIREG
jgi:hypothetical protein